MSVFAGDIVEGEAAPDVCRDALAALGADSGRLTPESMVVIEDSASGLQAAVDAGLRTLFAVSPFTVPKVFTGAALVVPSLGNLASNTISYIPPVAAMWQFDGEPHRGQRHFGARPPRHQGST